MPNEFVKDPDAVLDYKFDWKARTNNNGARDKTDWLDTTETISSHTIDADTGITVNSSVAADTNTSIVVWLAGGEAGTTYKVRCEIVTSAGRTDERTARIKVVER